MLTPHLSVLCSAMRGQHGADRVSACPSALCWIPPAGLQRETAALGRRRGLPPSCLSPAPLRTTLVTLLHHSTGSSFPQRPLNPTDGCPTHAEPASLHPSLRDASISISLGLSPSGASLKLRDINSARPTFKHLCFYHSKPCPSFSQPQRW